MAKNAKNNQKANKNSQSTSGGGRGGRARGGRGRSGGNSRYGRGNGQHQGSGWSPGKEAAVNKFLKQRDADKEIKKDRASSQQLMDVFMPSIAASHAMSLVALGAVDAAEASKLAHTFEKSQRARFKEVQKLAEKKKKAKLKAKSGKTDKEKMGKLLAAFLGDDADDSDSASEDTRQSLCPRHDRKC